MKGILQGRKLSLNLAKDSNAYMIEITKYLHEFIAAT